MSTIATARERVKKLELPRPLKTTLGGQLSLYVDTHQDASSDEIIRFAEEIALALLHSPNDGTLQHPLIWLLSRLKNVGQRIEHVYKDTLDKIYIMFRNASQNDNTHFTIRMRLLELIELRANNWKSSDSASHYYKQRASHSIEPESPLVDPPMLCGSPPLGLVSPAPQILSPGEVLKASGKYKSPTKIAGKNYCKDEVVIRNADSGKVMGIKGRRVHMIEELSETIISFQRVTPGAKERLVQITGQKDDNIELAKQLIGDTIRRNASPVRLEDPIHEGSVPRGGSVDSLNSLNEELGGHNRMLGGLHHSYSANDATTLHMFTVNIGDVSIKMTSHNLQVLAVAKCLLDKNLKDELKSQGLFVENESDDSEDTYKVHNNNVNSAYIKDFMARSTSSNGLAKRLTSPPPPLAQEDDVFIIEDDDSSPNHELSFSKQLSLDNVLPTRENNSIAAENRQTPTVSSPLTSPALSVASSNATDTNTTPPINNKVVNRRIQFPRKSSENLMKEVKKADFDRALYTYEVLIAYAMSPLAGPPPKDWDRICKEYPGLVRKVDHSTITKSYNPLARPVFNKPPYPNNNIHPGTATNFINKNYISYNNNPPTPNYNMRNPHLVPPKMLKNFVPTQVAGQNVYEC